jgi:hypothetical protein
MDRRDEPEPDDALAFDAFLDALVGGDPAGRRDARLRPDPPLAATARRFHALARMVPSCPRPTGGCGAARRGGRSSSVSGA